MKWQRLERYLPIIACLCVFLLHLWYIPNGFTWLDHGDIEQGRTIRILPEQLGDIPFERYGETGFYRPAVTLMNSIDYALYGVWSPGYHLTNVVLHILVAWVASLFAAECLGWTTHRNRRMAITILIIGIHPIGFLPVGVISYRQEIMYTLFTLLAGLSFLREYRLYTAVCFLLALWSKETALFIVPCLLVVCAFGRKKIAMSIWMWCVIVGVCYLGLRYLAVPEVWRISPISLPLEQAIGTRLFVLIDLLKSLVWPVIPHLSDATRIHGFVQIYTFISLGLVAIGVWIIWKTGLSSLWGKLLISLGVSLAPALQILPAPRFSSPHYGYLASMFMAMLMVSVAEYVLKTSRLAYIGIILWIMIAGVATARAGSRFATDMTLFAPEVVLDPKYREGWQYLADAYMAENHMDKAEQAYLSALRPSKGVIAFADTTTILNNFAGLRVKQQRYDEADVLLRQIEADPRSQTGQMVRYNRALLAFTQKKYRVVVALLSKPPTDWIHEEPRRLLEVAQGLVK